MRKRWIGSLLCLSMLAFGSTACSQPQNGGSGIPASSMGSSAESGEAGAEYHKITQKEAKEIIDAGGVTIVDVRREEEYRERHIPDALLVPNESIGDSQPEQLPDLDEVLLVYCRTGVRSKQASEKLVKLGYTNVYDIGGITTWPYDTVSEESGGIG